MGGSRLDLVPRKRRHKYHIILSRITIIIILTMKQTYRQTDRHKDRLIERGGRRGRQTNRQTDRQTGLEEEAGAKPCMTISLSPLATFQLLAIGITIININHRHI